MRDAEREFVLVLTTAGGDEEARRIADALVVERLAACVNVVPGVFSVYRWKGEVHRDEERLLLVKTEGRLLPAVREAIRRLHSYELPEVVAIPIGDGDPDYLRWLSENLRDSATGRDD